MGKWQALYSADYMNAPELEGKKVTLTIAVVKGVELEGENKKKSTKAVVYFKEPGRKPFVMAKTNAACIGAMFGDECDNWKGKRITLHSEMVSVSGEMVPGIRLVGSPDIAKPVEVVIKHPRKRPVTMVMQPTGIKANGSARPQQPVEPAETEPTEDAPEVPPEEERIDF